MTAIVNGHGKRENDQTTFVPVGQTLKFYAELDMDLSTSANLVALAAGSFADPVETVEGTGQPTDVLNYTYNKEDDSFIAKWYAMGGEAGLDIWWVGSDRLPDKTRMCENLVGCAAAGVHRCRGVLGRVADPEIVILACRGRDGDETAPMYTKVGANPEDPLYTLADDTYAETQRLLDLVRKDPDAAEAEVDSYPQASVALFTNNKDFNAWLLARTARDYAARSDLEQLFGHLRANRENLKRIAGWLGDIPGYGQVIDDCAAAEPETFVAWLQYYQDAELDKLIKGRGATAAIRARVLDQQALRQQREAASASDPGVPDGPCHICTHLLSVHDPDSGCAEDDCECGYGTSWYVEPAAQATSATADAEAVCGRCTHARRLHDAVMGCTEDGCICIVQPTADEEFVQTRGDENQLEFVEPTAEEPFLQTQGDEYWLDNPPPASGDLVDDQDVMTATAPAWTGPSPAVLVSGLQSQAAALTQAVSGLTGGDGEDEAVVGIETAMETLMADADSLQKMAGRPGSGYLLEPSIGLFNAGADAATKLALHKESQDGDSLAALESAFELVGQWADSLPSVGG